MSGSAVYTEFGPGTGSVVQRTEYRRPSLNTCTYGKTSAIQDNLHDDEPIKYNQI